MATAGTHNYRIFMERGLPPVQSITRRWLRGSLLITICILAAALGLFLYYSHQNLYGGVQRAMQARFSTVEGRLQATGTAGSSQATSESRSQSLRRTVEQFDEKDKFEFMLLDSSGVVLATSSVRERAVAAVLRSQTWARKEAEYSARISEKADGHCSVRCQVKALDSELFCLDIGTPDRLSAEMVKKQFILKGNEIYQMLITKLTEEEK